jgi:hypothetical protein
MKDNEHLNMLAVLADAEARSTAMLVEVIAAAALFRLNPPEGDAVVELEIKQSDVLDAAKDYFWQADYDEHGTMHLRLSRKLESLIPAQPGDGAEVTSNAAD